MPVLTDPFSDADLTRLAELEAADARNQAERMTIIARMSAATSARDLGWAGEAPWDSLLMEVAGTLRIGQVAASNRLCDAATLTEQLPGTLAALREGRLFVPQARVILQETEGRSAEVCARVEADVLPTADRYAPGDLKHRVQRAVLRADPAGEQERHEEQRAKRNVIVRPAPDGMSELRAFFTALNGRRFITDLDVLLARAVRDDDLRSRDQQRADTLADLPGLALELLDQFDGILPPLGIPSLLDQYASTTGNAATGGGGTADSSAPSRTVRRRRKRKTQVIVQVPVCTAVGLSDQPVWLDGHGWIAPGQALVLLTEAELRKACLDAQTGRLVALGDPILPTADSPTGASPTGEQADQPDQRPDHRRTARVLPPDPAALADAIHSALLAMVTDPHVVTRDDPSRRTEPQHDPSDPLRDYVDLRDGGCDGPGCTVHANNADRDHQDPWPHGATRAANLAVRSKRCHQAKHHGWAVHRDPDGTSTWISPGGRRYTRHPRHAPPDKIDPRRTPRPVLPAH